VVPVVEPVVPVDPVVPVVDPVVPVVNQCSNQWFQWLIVFAGLVGYKTGKRPEKDQTITAVDQK
jgi:hypothetical protein